MKKVDLQFSDFIILEMVRRFRSRRRGSRKILSTKRIFSRRSARSQANQIYALRRRMSSMYRRLRPEIKIKYNTAQQFNLSSDQLTNTYKSFLIQPPTLGDGDNERMGNTINIKNMQLNFTFEYYNNSDTGYHNSESSGTPLRIIVGQYKGGNSGTTPQIEGVLEEYGNSGAAYTNQVVSPLKNSQTEFSKILIDRRFVLTSDKNQRIIRYNIHPSNYRFGGGGSTINYVWVMVLSSGLHFDTNFAENVSCTFSNKIAYTDS